MDEALNPISSRKLATHKFIAIDSDLTSDNVQTPLSKDQVATTSLEDLGNIVKNEPNAQAISQILQRLNESRLNFGPGVCFNILVPNSKSSRVLHALTVYTVPTFWPIFSQDVSHKTDRLRLRQCFCSTMGIGLLLSHIRALVDDVGNKTAHSTRPHGAGSGSKDSSTLANCIGFLQAVMEPDTMLRNLGGNISKLDNLGLKSASLKDSVNIIASGKVPSMVAEAIAILSAQTEKVEDQLKPIWLANGEAYARWLGKSIRTIVLANQPNSALWTVELIKKSLSFGYQDFFVAALLTGILNGQIEDLEASRAILDRLSDRDLRLVFYALFCLLDTATTANSRMIPHAAALLRDLAVDPGRCTTLWLAWLVGPGAESYGSNQEIRRVVILALVSLSLDESQKAIMAALQLFSDVLFIKHSPVLHQHVNAEILLLLLSHIHQRGQITIIISLSKQSLFLTGVSNHLAATSPRVREIGMVVGTIVSQLVDQPSSQLKFSTEETNTEVWLSFQSLINLKDEIGILSDLRLISQDNQSTGNVQEARTTSIIVKSSSSHQAPKLCQKGGHVIDLEGINGDESDDDCDLVPYPKPSSDTEDDDEDPTLVTRNRPKAPVYVRDLLLGLRDTKNYEVHMLALKSAPSLLRRKAHFGTEVSDHIIDILSLLVGLGDQWNMPDFVNLRLQAMIAAQVANPVIVGKWLARSFYCGDYSLAQRLSILTTMGLGAREIANVASPYRETDPKFGGSSFPSQQLPPVLHDKFTDAAIKPLNTVSGQMMDAMLKPLAASAADKLSGPNVLKIRTFSSRLEVEKTRAKPSINPLSKIVADTFFYPLTGRWQVLMGSVANNNTIRTGAVPPQKSPLLLSQLLKTLGMIIMAAGGPLIPSFSSLTAEWWAFLLSLRHLHQPSSSGISAGNNGQLESAEILEGLLFSFLTLLELNDRSDSGRRQLAQEQGRAILETQEWAEQVLGGLHGGDEESNRCKALAAGVVMHCHEIVNEHQRILMGNLAGYVR